MHQTDISYMPLFLFLFLSPPRPDPVMWTKDGGELPDLDRMIVEGRELTFTSLNKTDNGTYRCEASNHLGTSSDEYVLYVYGEFRGKNWINWMIIYHVIMFRCKRNLQ